MAHTVVTAREYLRAADIPPPSVADYGTVALPGLATEVDHDRLLRI